MDFSQSQMQSLISSNQTDEKAKYSTAIRKLDAVSSIFTSLMGRSFLTKLVETDYKTLKLTSNPSLILDNISVTHPLVKLLVEYVQKMEVLGDASKFFVALVRFLVKHSFLVVEKGVKPAVVSEMFRDMSGEIDNLSKDLVEECCVDFDDEKSVSRILKGLIRNKKVSELVSKAVCGSKSFNNEYVRVCKIPSGSIDDSLMVEGMVFERAPEGRVQKVTDATTSIYNTPLDINRTELKGTIMMTKADDLLKFSKSEVESIRSVVDGLKSDVIITAGKVDNVYLDFLNDQNKLVFKIVSKHDIRRIRNLLGGTISMSLTTLGAEDMGRVKEVSTFLVGDKKYTKFIGTTGKMHTLILKDSLEVVLDEHEREITKSLRALEKNISDKKIKIVPGSGQFERKLSDKLVEKSNEVFGSDVHKFYAYKCLSSSLSEFKVEESDIVDIYNAKNKAVKYALDFVATMYETDSYLIGKREMLDIKPKTNQHWDEDH